VYRAVDQHGQVIAILVSKRRNVPAATKFFETMLAGRERPREVTTDLAAPLLRVVDDPLPDALNDTAQYANNRIECDHGTAQGEAAADARSANGSDRVNGDQRSRVRPEPATLTLRTRR
jgi:transposase-like protein